MPLWEKHVFEGVWECDPEAGQLFKLDIPAYSGPVSLLVQWVSASILAECLQGLGVVALNVLASDL